MYVIRLHGIRISGEDAKGERSVEKEPRKKTLKIVN